MKTLAPEVGGAAARPSGVPGHTHDDGTRERVMALIMEKGATTAAAIAEALDITPAAVRRHLATLTRRGLVTTRERRPPGTRERGRPAKVYVLTDAGRADFAHAYDALAIELLDYLRRTGGPEAVAEFARDRFGHVEDRYRAAMAADPGADPLQALAAVLCDDGFMAALHPVRSGQQLCQHHCPVAHVAARFPELCTAEGEVFGRLLGSHVQRLATIAHGDGVCTLHVPAPVTPARTGRTTTDKEST